MLSVPWTGPPLSFLSTLIISYYLSNKKDNPSEYKNQQSQTMRLLLLYPESRLFAQNKSKNFVQDFLKYTRQYFRRLGSTRDENQKWEANAMKKKKMSDMTPRQLRCPHCGAVAIIRPASEIYDDPRRKDELYVCKNYPACKSYVGMHAGNPEFRWERWPTAISEICGSRRTVASTASGRVGS